MHRWMHRAAGGTIHRLKPGSAIVVAAIEKTHRVVLLGFPIRPQPYFFVWLAVSPVRPPGFGANVELAKNLL